MEGSSEKGAFLAAAESLLREHTPDYQRQKRAVVFWGIALFVVSALLCLVAAGYLVRIVFYMETAYAIGGLIHFGLGYCLHELIISRGGRRSSRFVWMVLFAVCIAAIGFIFVARLQDLIARGRDPVTAFFQSFFVMLLEIVMPSLCGVALGEAELGYRRAREDVEYFRVFTHRMDIAPGPGLEWIQEVQRLEGDLDKMRHNRTSAEIEGNIGKARELEEEIARLDSKIEKMKVAYPGDFEADRARLSQPQQPPP